MILIVFSLLAAACTATGTITSNEFDNQKDLSPADVEDEVFPGPAACMQHSQPGFMKQIHLICFRQALLRGMPVRE